MKLQTRMGLNCPVCGHDTTQNEDAATELALFGAANPYAVCPACCREIFPEQQADPEYRRRVRMAYFARTGKPLRS